MADIDDPQSDAEKLLEETADNPGARTAALRTNPKMGLEEGRNAAEGEGPNAMGGGAPNPDEDRVTSTYSPEGSPLPNPQIPFADGASSDDPSDTNQ